MANTYTWRPTGGNYYSSSGSSAGGSNHFYYSSNRAFRMDFPNLSGQLGKDKKTLSITSAILKVYISTANSATLTIGYSYKTAFDDRKTMLAKVTGVKMKTSTGWMSIDLTDVIKAYAKDGSTSTMRLWGYGTGGSTTNSNFRGSGTTTTAHGCSAPPIITKTAPGFRSCPITTMAVPGFKYKYKGECL